MKRNALMATALLGALCLATSAWAGGASCTGKSEGASTEAGAHCAMGKMAAGGQCKIGANNAVFSYAVPTAHCGACANKIQTAAMAQKGVVCAKVDVDTHMAYVAGDKKLNQRAIAKAIKDAGFDCQFKQSGMKARTELNKLMAAENEKAAAKKS